ncbi:MAG: hypothetical protein M1418_06580 [Deltaproteobacteria bacterium]|nr:hypothetical protein [Deltaproteobacteria bacterium]
MSKRSLCAHFLLATLLFFSGCSGTWLDSPASIKDVLDKPRDYEGRIVMISGEVTDVFSLFVVKSFSVRDKTGEIIVVTKRILPKKGETIKVRGKVVDAFSFGDKSITAFVEIKE